MSDGIWRVVFLTAAIFNWLVGASLLVDTSAFAASLGMETLRFDPLYTPLVGLFIILFGAFSFCVFLDLNNRAIVVVKDGDRLLALHAPDSTIFTVDWDVEAARPAGPPLTHRLECSPSR